MKTHTVRRVDGPVPLTGAVEGPWAGAATARIDEFDWCESGPRPVTEVRAVYDDAALSLQYDVEDSQISSQVTDLHGPVHTDSCVEFFATPEPGENANYLNFEANPCGCFKMTWMEPGWSVRGIGRESLSEEPAAEIEVATSEPGPTRDPTDGDEGWWLTVRFPFDVLSTLTGRALAPESGDRWRANVHRTGVESLSQEASWNPIGTPEKQFHSPAHFGWFVFE